LFNRTIRIWAANATAANRVADRKDTHSVNIVLSNVKRAIGGRYHAIRQAKVARRYLAEAAYRFNRRFRRRERGPRLARAIMLRAPCPDSSLRLASNFLR